MTSKIKLLLAIILANFFTIHSQTSELTKKDSIVVSSWIFGIGFNAVDDSDDQFYRLLDIKDAWNAVPYPSRLSIGKYFKNGLGIEAIAAYNKYKSGKTVDGLPLTNNENYYSFDTRLSYDLNKIVGETGWFDPYLGVGIGFTHANDISRGTYNAVVGFRTWFSDRLGLDFNSTGKWTMNNNYTNHLQHAVGVVYRFNVEKELTKKGEAKLEMIKAEEKELLRLTDSIAFANRVADEKRTLAEKLEKEKERLAQQKNEEARNKEKNDIQNKLNDLETIYFVYNSSNLTSASKNTLSKLMAILNEYPKLTIEVSSHTDSRGSNTYNKKLSEGRLQSTLNYLLQNGMEPNRFTGKAYGEEKLTNECDDHTICSEIKHKQNRRSEFEILNF
ncbi:OmpA family protein [Mariniflexile sp.]|uniref:OmpA family protein n=1 Tax=Mariniflexile sp. TaxID=1979402 RepID=UPI00404893EA